MCILRRLLDALYVYKKKKYMNYFYLYKNQSIFCQTTPIQYLYGKTIGTGYEYQSKNRQIKNSYRKYPIVASVKTIADIDVIRKANQSLVFANSTVRKQRLYCSFFSLSTYGPDAA